MVDVVIPVYRPDEKLYALIKGLCSQNPLPGRIQIMLTTSGEECEGERLLHALNQVRMQCKGAESVDICVEELEKAAFDHGGTRNIGMSRCNAPYVLCMTQDAVPCNHSLLQNLLTAMESNERAAAVYARQVAGKNADILVRMTQNFNYPEQGCVKSRLQYKTLGIKTLFCSDVCCLYRKQIFERLGGFEEDLLFAEDMLYARKALDAGYQIVYEAAAKVEHAHSYTMWQQMRRNFDVAVNQADHPKVFAGLSSESEGMRYVKKVLRDLSAKNAYPAMVRFVFQSGAKYIGFFLGKHYRMLPKALVKKLTSNPSYFARKKDA